MVVGLGFAPRQCGCAVFSLDCCGAGWHSPLRGLWEGFTSKSKSWFDLGKKLDFSS